MIQYYMYASIVMGAAWLIAMYIFKDKHMELAFFDAVFSALKNLFFFVSLGDFLWGATAVLSTKTDIISDAVFVAAHKVFMLNVIIFALLIVVFFIQVLYQVGAQFWKYVKKTYGD